MRCTRVWWMAWTLAGCSGAPDSDLQAWQQSQRATARPHVAPLMVPKEFQPRSYNAESLVDPFDMAKLHRAWQRDVVQGAANAAPILPEHKRSKEALEWFSLDAMVMVGSLERQGQRTALLRVDKLLYQVRAGQYLGQNYGKVIQVSENSIKLRELIQDAAGDWVEKMTALDLQEEAK